MMRWKELRNGYKDRVTELAALPPHELLGVTIDATSEELKSAYIRMVKTYHPDRSDPFMARHNEEIIKLINIAYEKLKDRP
jgi:DnaJ-class molecular chaperone